MNILVIGSGGREHALAWKISQSKEVEKIYCAPGNAGTAAIAENIPVSAEDTAKLAEFAEQNSIGLTVVGPEQPLVSGLVDALEKRSLRAFGPSGKAAMLEGSKVFAKQIMKRYRIPTAEFSVFHDADEALDYAKELGGKVVVKADGLAAGKGVFVCGSLAEAKDAITKTMVEKKFGTAGEKIVVEELLQGEEASILAFTDGRTVVPMASAQDHKRIFDNDKGPNTGGMGAYSPAPVVTQGMEERIADEVLKPTVRAMRSEGAPYKGVLYAGLMINKDEINVLEFNARFGDPETQAILPRMESDIARVFESCIDGRLADEEIIWSKKAATCIVVASGGYPEAYEKGKVITGLDAVSGLKDVEVFHAGTKIENGKVVTSGGRVLGVTGLGSTVKGSIKRAYAAVEKIKFDKMHYRKDIGFRALKRLC